MNQITCDICMDLLPLVRDGVASEDSVQAVQEHIASCPQCRAMYEEYPPSELPDAKITAKIKSKLHTFFVFLISLGIFFGISLLVMGGIFYMALILPVIGGCSYVVYHWKALWKMPLILSILFLIAHMITVLQGADFNALGIVFWVAVITVLTDLGTLIVGLMHFALRKEKSV